MLYTFLPHIQFFHKIGYANIFFICYTHVHCTMPILKIYYIFIFKFCIDRLKKIVILRNMLYMNVVLY